MPSLSVQVVQRGEHSSLLAALKPRVHRFFGGVSDAQKTAAQIATETSRSGFKRIRPQAPSRTGRANDSMKSFITWKAVPGQADVALDLNRLDQNAPHWIIQEIGTGKRASMLVGGVRRATGRPSGASQSVRTVKSQRGRPIARGLVWSSGGRFAPPRVGASGQQLALASRVQDAPFIRKPMIIKNEIQGQHFVKRGAEAGFRHYRTSVLAAARESFRKGGSL